MSRGSVHCPQCGLYITNEDAEACPRCGSSLTQATTQGPDYYAPMTAAPQGRTTTAPMPIIPGWVATPQHEVPRAPEEAFLPEVDDQNVYLAQRSRRRRSSSAKRMMLTGCLMIVAGIVFTVASYIRAAPDGVYTIYLGAILFGVIRFMRGLSREDS